MEKGIKYGRNGFNDRWRYTKSSRENIQNEEQILFGRFYLFLNLFYHLWWSLTNWVVMHSFIIIDNSNVDTGSSEIWTRRKFPIIHTQRTVQTIISHTRPRVRCQVPLDPSRFTEEQAPHVYSEKQKSTEKLPPMPQEKPKNPFKTNLDEYIPSYAEISDSIASSSRRWQLRILPFRSLNRQSEADTPEQSRISIKIQQERAKDMPKWTAVSATAYPPPKPTTKLLKAATSLLNPITPVILPTAIRATTAVVWAF